MPYLSQDLWELGSSPTDIIKLIKNNINISSDTYVLDLASGKGAVSINIAKTFGCRVKGIDIIYEFINEAKNKANVYLVSSLWEFTVGDINQSVLNEKDYDITILGVVGNVLGNQEETLLNWLRLFKRVDISLLMMVI